MLKYCIFKTSIQSPLLLLAHALLLIGMLFWTVADGMGKSQSLNTISFFKSHGLLLTLIQYDWDSPSPYLVLWSWLGDQSRLVIVTMIHYKYCIYNSVC